jgi:hypothetical protein
MFVPITPRIVVETSDPFCTTMSTACQDFLSANPDFKPTSISLEMMAWSQICDQNRHACPPGL